MISISELTVDLVNAIDVILSQWEVVGIHPLVKRRHDGRRVTGVLQPQRMTQLMNGDQKQVNSFHRVKHQITKLQQ